MIVRKQGDWLSAKVGDELVMMSAEKGKYIGLSEVGARIWELIDMPQEIDAVCAQRRALRRRSSHASTTRARRRVCPGAERARAI